MAGCRVFLVIGADISAQKRRRWYHRFITQNSSLIVALKQDAVFKGLVSTLDLAMHLGVNGCTTQVVNAIFLEIFGKITRV